MSLSTEKYSNTLTELKDRIRQARMKAALSVNAHLLIVYWEIGTAVLSQQKQEGWGAKVIDRLSTDLKKEFPDMEGLSVRNIKYMRSFAEAFPFFNLIEKMLDLGIHPRSKSFVQQAAAQIKKGAQNEKMVIVQQLAAQLPWGHHQVMLDKLKTDEARFFYLSKCVENNWSRNVLSEQIRNGLMERNGKAINNFPITLPAPQSDLANESIKNPYNLEFFRDARKYSRKRIGTRADKSFERFYS